MTTTNTPDIYAAIIIDLSTEAQETDEYGYSQEEALFTSLQSGQYFPACLSEPDEHSGEILVHANTAGRTNASLDTLMAQLDEDDRVTSYSVCYCLIVDGWADTTTHPTADDFWHEGNYTIIEYTDWDAAEKAITA